MVLIDAKVPPEHKQVIRSNIGPESVEKCRDVQNEPIWTNFRKKAKGIVLEQFFQTSLYFLDTDCSIFKTCMIKRYLSKFFLYFNKYEIFDLSPYF
jgi:hypothetical protein